MAGGTFTFPARTTTVFQQANAPTGWTKVTSLDDYTLRIVGTSPFSGTPSGSIAFTTPGSTTWTVPVGVTSISIVAVGGGQAGSNNGFNSGGLGGSGGWLAYRNSIAVTPGDTLTITVGRGGAGTLVAGTVGEAGLPSSVTLGVVTFVQANGGSNPQGNPNIAGQVTNSGGGGSGAGYTSSGPTYENGAGGGAGGYAGVGGSGGFLTFGSAGSGGGGGGGRSGTNVVGGAGGGVGIFGQGANGGAAVLSGRGGLGGSGGADGGFGTGPVESQRGGNFGGGGGGRGGYQGTPASGGDGAVRIVWGPGRSFPSTNVSEAFDNTIPAVGNVNFTAVHASGQTWPGSLVGGGGSGSTGAATAASSNHSHFGSSWGSPNNPLWFNVAGGPVPGSLQFYNNMSSYQTAPAGGSVSHSHPLSIGGGTFSGGSMSQFALQYVDCILASID